MSVGSAAVLVSKSTAEKNSIHRSHFKDSDIDLLVILPSTDMQTRDIISDITWEVSFEAGKIISAIPAIKEHIAKYGFLPIYRSIKKEGVTA